MRTRTEMEMEMSDVSVSCDMTVSFDAWRLDSGDYSDFCLIWPQFAMAACCIMIHACSLHDMLHQTALQSPNSKQGGRRPPLQSAGRQSAVCFPNPSFHSNARRIAICLLPPRGHTPAAQPQFRDQSGPEWGLGTGGPVPT